MDTCHVAQDFAWDTLVTLGYVEERRDEKAATQRLLRLTEKGRRAADGGR
jgi:DNA-binding MarR family transcriptional regulator